MCCRLSHARRQSRTSKGQPCKAFVRRSRGRRRDGPVRRQQQRRRGAKRGATRAAEPATNPSAPSPPSQASSLARSPHKQPLRWRHNPMTTQKPSRRAPMDATRHVTPSADTTPTSARRARRLARCEKCTNSLVSRAEAGRGGEGGRKGGRGGRHRGGCPGGCQGEQLRQRTSEALWRSLGDYLSDRGGSTALVSGWSAAAHRKAERRDQVRGSRRPYVHIEARSRARSGRRTTAVEEATARRCHKSPCGACRLQGAPVFTASKQPNQAAKRKAAPASAMQRQGHFATRSPLTLSSMALPRQACCRPPANSSPTAMDQRSESPTPSSWCVAS